MSAPLTVEQRTSIWNDVQETLSHHNDEAEVIFTTKNGREYTVASKIQNADGTWKLVEFFARTVTRCKNCNKCYSGIWTRVWHKDISVQISSKMFHNYFDHAADLPEFNEEYAQVFLN